MFELKNKNARRNELRKGKIRTDRQGQDAYYQKNREALKAKSKKRYYAEPEKMREKKRQYYLKHKEVLCAKEAARRLKVPHDVVLAMRKRPCEICKEVVGKTLCVDHDHTTGKIRGTLCGQCNTGLGLFKDNVGLLHLAIAYLESHHV